MLKMIKIHCLLLLVAGLFCQEAAQGQILGPYGTSPITFEVDASGLLSATGTFGTGTFPASLTGAGTRMFWYPKRAAFRAGYVAGDTWDDTGTFPDIGNYSAAFGYSTLASGTYSVAHGYYTSATANYSTAFGYQTLASGSCTTAWGDLTTASGIDATALGAQSTASGGQAVSTGQNTLASGKYALTAGYYVTASGKGSVAFGANTTAAAYNSLAMGEFNVGLGSTGDVPNGLSDVATDPIFEIGNGTSATAPNDAFVVYKNGNAAFQGAVTVAPSGDIPMFAGN